MLGPHAPAQVCRVLAMTRRPYKDPASRTHLLTFLGACSRARSSSSIMASSTGRRRGTSDRCLESPVYSPFCVALKVFSSLERRCGRCRSRWICVHDCVALSLSSYQLFPEFTLYGRSKHTEFRNTPARYFFCARDSRSLYCTSTTFFALQRFRLPPRGPAATTRYD